MFTSKFQRLVAAGVVAAALVVGSLGSNVGVSASAINDDALGSATLPTQPVAAVPFTPAYTVNAVPFAAVSAGQVDNSITRNN